MRGPEPDGLRVLARAVGREADAVRWVTGGEVEFTGVRAERVGDLAHDQRVRLHELRPVEASLEEAYLRLTSESVEYADERDGRAGRGGRTPVGHGRKVGVR